MTLSRIWPGALAALAVWSAGASAAALELGQPAPAFTLPRLDGAGTLSTEGLRGTRAQLVVFWAADCGACRVEAPRLQKLFRRLKGKPISVVAVHIHDDPAEARRYAKVAGLTYPNAIDEDFAVADMYGTRQTPAVYLIDRQGMLRYHHWRLPSMAKIEQVMR